MAAYVVAATLLLAAACGGSQAPTAPVGGASAGAPTPLPAAPTASADGNAAQTPMSLPSATARPLATTPTTGAGPAATVQTAPAGVATPTAVATLTATPIARATPNAIRATVVPSTPEAATATSTISAADLQLASTLDEIGRRVSTLRELPALRPIQRAFMTRKELAARLRKDLEEDREEIYEAQRLYAALGILGQEDDLSEIILGLLGEGVLGFYDAEEEKFYIVKDASEFEPAHARTYAHEFVHGVQQQHFDFQATRESLEGNSDAEFALRALIEGDASLGTSIYLFQHMSAEERAASQPTISAALTQAFRSAPHVLQQEYTFPYREGTAFVTTLYQRGGWAAVNDAFVRIPQSTEQVLHPEKYRSGEPPLQVEIPDILPALGDGWELLITDTLGEFLLRAYLETGFYARDPRTAAGGWGGDQVRLYTGPGDETVLVLSALWDTARDAREFFDTFLQFTSARTGGEWESLGEDTWLMTLADERIAVSLRGTATLVIVAPDRPTLDGVRSALE